MSIPGLRQGVVPDHDPRRSAPGPAASARMKRLVDVLASTAGIVVGAPAFAAIAVAVKVDSPGPVLFRQERVGLGGEHFHIHKFRTMQVVRPGEVRVAVTASGDSRVTRTGRILRRTKLDELPQLFDVLRGAMSLVGPRPEVPRYVDHWDPATRAEILSVRPGITDPASLLGIDEGAELAAVPDPDRYYIEVILPRKQRLYVDYVRTATLRGDLRLIGATVLALSPRRGRHR